MAETGIAMLAEPPLHLRELQAEARRQTAHFFREHPDPEAGEFYERTYLMLRVQAYQRDMEPFTRWASRFLALLPPGRMLLMADGTLEVSPPDLQPAVLAQLKRATATIAAHYELEPTNV